MPLGSSGAAAFGFGRLLVCRSEAAFEVRSHGGHSGAMVPLLGGALDAAVVWDDHVVAEDAFELGDERGERRTGACVAGVGR
jgi:hypothetical protein